MTLRALREVRGPAGRLEVRVDAPAGPPRAVAVIAAPHPQLGGTLNDRVVYHVAQGLGRLGCVVWRFNYRGVGTSEGAFDQGVGEMDDFRAVVDAASEATPQQPIWAVGYSFGAWIAGSVGAADPRVSLVLAVAPAVAGYDFSALAGSAKPTFLIHGERDDMTPLKEVRKFYATLDEPRELIVIDGADHVFDGQASQVADAVEELLADE